MDSVSVFIAVAAAFVVGNIILAIVKDKNAHFYFNVLLLLLLAGMDVYMLYGNVLQSGYGIVSLNPFSLFFLLIFTLGILLVNVAAYPYSDHYSDFALLASFSLAGMYAVASAQSLITILIGLELAAIPTVFIVLLQKKALEASTKFLIMVSIAIAIISFATVLVYGATNSLSLASYPQTTILAFAALLFVSGLGLEASFFPFNVLVPDVYQGAPAYVTSMLGGINKKVAFAALLQIVMLLFISYSFLFNVIAVLAVLTMFFGNIAALSQFSLKRILAYSSISQAGYIMIGVAAASALGVEATLFQIFAHMFLFIGVLSIFAWLESHNRKSINDLAGLNSENRFAAFAISLFLLSLVGLPFTTGFVGKFLLFTSAISSNLTWLAIVGIINSVISIYYYTKIIIAMYAKKEDARPLRMDAYIATVALACLAITLAFGIYPQPLITMATNAGTFLVHAIPVP